MGLTTDGLVLRSRYTHEQRHDELGLLDPATGRTAWLPPPPISARAIPVELTEDRLVLSAQVGIRRMALLVFDRRSRAWETPIRARTPAGLEAHVPFRLALAPDGRLYLGSTYENDPRPMGWWSYSVPQGGDGWPEPDLIGEGVAWKDGVRARADGSGRVVLSGRGGERVVAGERPEGCAANERSIANAPVTVGLAAGRPVVTYWCGDDVGATTTFVYGAGGGSAIQIAGASLVAADENHALLVSALESPDGVYLLDIDRHRLTRIGTRGHEAVFALANGLVLWNEAGPIDDRDVYDEVWNVARLPVGSGIGPQQRHLTRKCATPNRHWPALVGGRPAMPSHA
jgi:hypothetical protein